MSPKNNSTTRIFTETPDMMRSRRLIQNSLRGKTGEPVHEDQLHPAWQQLSLGERNMLRTAHFVNIMTKPVTHDLKNIYLNLAFFAIALIPGPGAMFIIPGLALSYAVRWDKRAVEARKKIAAMIRSDDGTIEKYAQFIKKYHHNKGEYNVDMHSLMKMKMENMKHATLEVQKAAARHVPHVYNKFVKNPLRKCADFFHRMTGKCIGEERAEKCLRPVFNAVSCAEDMVLRMGKKTAKEVDYYAQKAGSKLKEVFENVVEIKEQCGELIYSGIEYNKYEIKNALRNLPSGSKPF